MWVYVHGVVEVNGSQKYEGDISMNILIFMSSVLLPIQKIKE